MRRSNLATFVYLAVVFVSGAVVGGFAVRLYLANSVSAVVQTRATKNHAELRRMYIQEMQNRLHLSDAQATQLQEISDATGQRMRDTRKTIDDEHVQKVNAILDDGQRAEYAKMREEREKRRQEQESKK
ncbi:MAG: hypothetical protein ABSH50_03650 [Bryobacteraceae bacterium]|jgi:hypothetical protein